MKNPHFRRWAMLSALIEVHVLLAWLFCRRLPIGEPRMAPMLLAWGACLSASALLAVWMALAWERWLIRLPRVLILVAILNLAPAVFVSPSAAVWELMCFQLPIFLGNLLVLSGMRVVFGWRLAPREHADRPPREWRGRLTLDELLLQTAGFAVVFLLATALQHVNPVWIPLGPSFYYQILAIGLSSSLLVVSGVGIVLRATYSRRRVMILLVTALAGAIAMPPLAAAAGRSDDWPLWVLVMVGFVTALLGSLLVVRLAGIRLISRGNQNMVYEAGASSAQPRTSHANPHDAPPSVEQLLLP